MRIPPPVPVAAPPRVAARLAAADGPVPVLHRGAHATYVDVAGRCVGVVATTAAHVPCAMRVTTPDLRRLAGSREARVVHGVLHLDGVPLVVGRRLDVTVPRLASADRDPARHPRVEAVARTLPSEALAALGSPEPDRLGDPVPVVDALVGRGDGLTPLGDDVLCGWLAVQHATGADVGPVRAAVTAALPRTTLLSATLLDCALHGEVLPEFSAWVAARSGGDREAAAARLVRVGHTSGAGMLLGADLALSRLAHRDERMACA